MSTFLKFEKICHSKLDSKSVDNKTSTLHIPNQRFDYADAEPTEVHQPF